MGDERANAHVLVRKVTSSGHKDVTVSSFKNLLSEIARSQTYQC